jgi:hypothetical protein
LILALFIKPNFIGAYLLVILKEKSVGAKFERCLIWHHEGK